jgi:hypothetical protein
MHARESFLGRLEDGLTRMSGWLAARRRGSDPAGFREQHARLEAARREVASARRAISERAHADLAHVRASFDDMKGDYDVPSPHVALSHEEREALRRHLHTTARLLRDRSNLDDPNWEPANEEYDRSWAELERAFEPEGSAASP